MAWISHLPLLVVLLVMCTFSIGVNGQLGGLGLPPGHPSGLSSNPLEKRVSWASWTPWSTCSASCGGGLQKRIRFCPRQDEHEGGCFGAGVQVRRCSLSPCFGLGLLDSWATWTDWSSCCGQREQLRTRVCRIRGRDTRQGHCYGTSLEVRECASSACKEIRGVASFNMNGVQGNISFSQGSPSSPVVIDVQLEGAGLTVAGLTWHVHEFPLSYTTHPSQQCSAVSVGGHYDPYRKAQLSQYAMRCARNAADCEVGDLSGRHGELKASAAYSDRFLALSGHESIIGRSVVIHRADGTRWVCTTILPAGKVAMRTAVAHFNGPTVGGTITIRQSSNDPKADSGVLVDLYRTDGATLDTFQHNWHVYTSPVSISNDTTVADSTTRCLSAGSPYDPLKAMQNRYYARDCSARQQDGCKLGALSDKHGRLNLPSAGRYRAFFTDSFLPLSGPYTVINRPIVIQAGSGIEGRLACADIVELLPRQMSATFDMSGVKGVMTFSQASPWDPTEMTFGLTGLSSQAGGYHVHEFPRSVHGTTQHGSPCSGQEVGSHWNPFSAPFPAQVPAGFQRTHDLYEVGDLSGKFGSLAGLQDTEQQHYDSYLPLFGPHSIAGRSIVIHRNLPDAPRWVCADIEMPQTSRRSATARFMSPFAGMIYFRQIDQFETSVFVDLRRSDGQQSSRDHNWHVHMSPVAEDQFSMQSPCASAAGHYNPFNVSIAPAEFYACSPGSQHRCEVGDSAGKSSTLNFDVTAGTKYVYTDSFLPLEGQYSVTGRSVVIHAANRGGGRVACANVEAFSRRRAQAPFGNSGVSGFVSFRQNSPLSATVVSVQLSGVLGRAAEYTLHYLPTTSASTSNAPTASPVAVDPCGVDTIGGVYNPTGTTSSTPPSAQSKPTADMCAAGSLSEKFGSLKLLTGIVSSYADEHYLPMTGPLNFVGRSVALHHARDNTPWVCSSIQYLGGRLVTAVAKFAGSLVGEIRFHQVNNLPTQVTIRLKHGQVGTPSEGHMWAVHARPAGADYMSISGRCLSAGQVHNPANVSSADLAYAGRCSASTATCRLGDLWYRQGLLRLAASQQVAHTVLLTEDFLPLSGPFSVIGRSVVVRVQQMGEERLACATIQQQ